MDNIVLPPCSKLNRRGPGLARVRVKMRKRLVEREQRMGKTSRRKEFVGVSPGMRLGITWAAELIRSPEIVGTALSNRKLAPPVAANDDPNVLAQLMTGLERARDASKPANLTPATWALSFEKALDNAKFVALLQATIEAGHQAFWAQKDPLSALLFGGNQRPPEDDPIAQAIVRSHRRLTADKAGPGWTALALFSLARMVAVNAGLSYDRNQWSDVSFAWFDLDGKLFEGDGEAVAKLLVKLDRNVLRGDMAKLVGARMLHGLAEAAINARETALFS